MASKFMSMFEFMYIFLLFSIRIEFFFTTIRCGFRQSIDWKLYIVTTHSSVYYYWHLQRGTSGNKKNCKEEGILCVFCCYLEVYLSISIFISLWNVFIRDYTRITILLCVVFFFQLDTSD